MPSSQDDSFLRRSHRTLNSISSSS
jgi:hypothetical protein